MDTKDITAVFVKVAGLLMLAFAAFELPAYFPPQSGARDSILGALMEAAAMLTLPVLLGLFLWFFPGTVTNRIVRGDKVAGARFGVREFERVALTVLGAWLVAYGIADFVYSISTLLFLQREYAEVSPPMARYLPGLIASVVKVVVGLCFAFGASGIVIAFDRVRSRGGSSQ